MLKRYAVVSYFDIHPFSSFDLTYRSSQQRIYETDEGSEALGGQSVIDYIVVPIVFRSVGVKNL